MKTFFLFSLNTLLLASIFSCQKQNTPSSKVGFLEVQFIEEICCGNLLMQENQTVQNFAKTRRDSLLYGLNIEAFEEIEIGDIFQIKFEVLPFPVPEEFDYDCEIICNRWHGIPIKIIELMP